MSNDQNTTTSTDEPLTESINKPAIKVNSLSNQTSSKENLLNNQTSDKLLQVRNTVSSQGNTTFATTRSPQVNGLKKKHIEINFVVQTEDENQNQLRKSFSKPIRLVAR